MGFLQNKRGLLYFLIWIIGLSLFIVFHSEPNLIGDEGHYIKLASRLQQGWYTDSKELDLWYGPGYPLVLAFLMLFSKNLLFLRLVNALFIALSALLVWNHFKKFVAPLYLNVSIVFIYLNLSAHKIITQTITEPFVLFLITCIVLLTLKRIYPMLLGLLIGLLILTKVVFYLILPISLLFYLFLPMKINWKDLLKTATMALVISLPYLLYTYSLTNKVYYPGSSGGQNFYWQAASREPLKGEWHHLGGLMDLKGTETDDLEKSLLLIELKRHEDYFVSIADLNPVVQDITIKKKAIEEIKLNPGNYIKNTLFTISRMFFSFPVSGDFSVMKIALYLPNGIIQIIMLVFVVFHSLKNKEDNFISWILFLSVYLVVHFALNGLARQYLIITPIILIMGLELLVQQKKAILKS